jgi:phage protein D
MSMRCQKKKKKKKKEKRQERAAAKRRADFSLPDEVPLWLGLLRRAAATTAATLRAATPPEDEEAVRAAATPDAFAQGQNQERKNGERKTAGLQQLGFDVQALTQSDKHTQTDSDDYFL